MREEQLVLPVVDEHPEEVGGADVARGEAVAMTVYVVDEALQQFRLLSRRVGPRSRAMASVPDSSVQNAG
jgi:hypothetical protein